jgi:hypothetical protein
MGASGDSTSDELVARQTVANFLPLSGWTTTQLDAAHAMYTLAALFSDEIV